MTATHRKFRKRLAATERLHQAREIRDVAVTLVKERGDWKRTGGKTPMSFLGFELEGLSFAFTTPYQKALSAGGENMRAYAIHTGLKPLVEYRHSLDIWWKPRGKVFRVYWNDPEGELTIGTFKRGEWEEELLQTHTRD